MFSNKNYFKDCKECGCGTEDMLVVFKVARSYFYYFYINYA